MHHYAPLLLIVLRELPWMPHQEATSDERMACLVVWDPRCGLLPCHLAGNWSRKYQSYGSDNSQIVRMMVFVIARWKDSMRRGSRHFRGALASSVKTLQL